MYLWGLCAYIICAHEMYRRWCTWWLCATALHLSGASNKPCNRIQLSKTDRGKRGGWQESAYVYMYTFSHLHLLLSVASEKKRRREE